MVDFENSTSMAVSAASVEGTECSFGGNLQTTPASEMQPAKRKRNLPGMPDPDAEVIALSPTTLLATNRFVCEICNKGFQRDQNLQLHRRGHNLPWKLKQRNGKDIRKRVYVCPEKTCVHHDPSRALGDLTGIKKHFSRKHGEKKWNCDRCSKKYAVQSDWKAHMKTCGTKEYRCDCGTMFSRRDSFITHRAFCDALAQESARSQTQTLAISSPDQHRHEETSKVEPIVHPPSCSPPPPPLTPSTGVLSPVQSVHSSDLPETATEKVTTATCLATNAAVTTTTTVGSNHKVTNTTGVFASIFASSALSLPPQSSPASYSDLICAAAGVDRTTTLEPMSLSLSSSLYRSPTAAAAAPPLFPPPDHRQYVQASQPAISATALLQKAAQMSSTSSTTSFLRALGLASTDAPNPNSMPERDGSSGLGLGLPSTGGREVLMGPSAPTTLDFLGLGMACGGASGTGDSTGGLSAFLTSMGGSRLDVSPASFGGVDSVHNDDWDDSDDQKPAYL